MALVNLKSLFKKINGDRGKRPQGDCPFEPGEIVAESGLYEICHSDEPRTSAVLVRGERFPVCNRCGEEVRYKLLQAVPHISEDPDFALPADNPANLSASPMGQFPRQLGATHATATARSYKPGEQIPASGIYKVIHSTHRRAHENIFAAGQTFPPCKHCGDKVRFQAVNSSKLVARAQ